MTANRQPDLARAQEIGAAKLAQQQANAQQQAPPFRPPPQPDVQFGAEPMDLTSPAKDDLQLWSVTTIIGVLEKRALQYWAAEQTAMAAVDNLRTWQAMLAERGRAETIKWLRDARERIPRFQLSSTDLGTVVHTVCERYALTGVRPGTEEIAALVFKYGTDQTDIDAETRLIEAMVDQFDDWLQRFTPSYQATEITVYHPEFNYAGQLDAILTIDGVRLLTDYKSSRESYDRKGQPRTPYPEQVGLQLAAYRYAKLAAPMRNPSGGWRPRRYKHWGRRYYLLGPDEQDMSVPVPEVDHGLVIQITPEHCEAYPIDCGPEAHRAFLYCMEMFRWAEITSRQIMGDPLT